MIEKIQQAETDLAELNPQPFYVPLGRWTPVVTAAFAGMSKRDWIIPGPRSRVASVIRGCSVERLKNPHSGAKPYKIAPSSHHPATRALHSVGIAIATGQPTLCILGAAALANGDFYEALNCAGLSQAPVLFLVINQSLGKDAPVSRQSSANPTALAKSFGLRTNELNGATRVESTVKKARENKKPTLILVNLEK